MTPWCKILPGSPESQQESAWDLTVGGGMALRFERTVSHDQVWQQALESIKIPIEMGFLIADETRFFFRRLM